MADEAPPDVPFDEALMPAEQPAELALIELDDRHMKYARDRWPKASVKMQAYRVRQAIWARFEIAKPHPDDPGRRKLGGAQPGSGRRPQKAIGAAIVDHFESRQKEVLDAIAAPLPKDSGATAMERHRAGMNIAKHAREERAMEIVEDDFARRTNDDIMREAAQVFAEMLKNGELDADDIFNSTAEEVIDAEPVEEGRQLTT